MPISSRLVFSLFLITVSLVNINPSLGQKTETSSALVTIPASQIRTIHSSTVGDDFNLLIHLPEGYDTTTGKVPVLYILDGENDFAPALEYLGLLKAECGIREPLLVAIGEGAPIGAAGNKRARDYTPSVVKQIPQSGGASAFLRFIETELIPYIETNYKADPTQRSIYGYSLGGLFTSYVLFHKATLFRNILIGSPALWYDNEKMLAFEDAYAKSNSDLTANVFIEVGDLEGANMIEPNKKLVQMLNGRNYKNLKLQSVILPNESHFTGKPSAMIRALSFAYCKPKTEKSSIELPEKVLQKLVGDYKISPDVTLTILLKDGQLYSQPSDQKYPYKLFAETDSRFFIKEDNTVQITFIKDKKDKVTNLVLHFQGKDIQGAKIK